MIYPEIRAITVGIEKINGVETLRIIYYLDRVPTDFDYENISDVAGEILGDFDINKVEEICEYNMAPVSKLVMLEYLVYARLET
jgi:hypothetical protein